MGHGGMTPIVWYRYIGSLYTMAPATATKMMNTIFAKVLRLSLMGPQLPNIFSYLFDRCIFHLGEILPFLGYSKNNAHIMHIYDVECFDSMSLYPWSQRTLKRIRL